MLEARSRFARVSAGSLRRELYLGVSPLQRREGQSASEKLRIELRAKAARVASRWRLLRVSAERDEAAGQRGPLRGTPRKLKSRTQRLLTDPAAGVCVEGV